jgi:hypothetical protein
MVTTTILFPVAARAQTEAFYILSKEGVPVSARPAIRVAPKGQSDWTFQEQKVGSPLSATVATPVSPFVSCDQIYLERKTGSPLTASVFFPKELTHHADVRFVQSKQGSPRTVSVSFPRIPHWHSSLLWQADYAGAAALTEIILFPKIPSHHVSALWQAERKQFYLASVSFQNDFKRYVTESLAFQYDWKGIVSTMLSYCHRSKVHAGWRIIARNIETDETTELGFIDAQNPLRSLENVELPNGQYEISVLTSSLFWKDARDHRLVTITVGANSDAPGLPIIYNLHSTVQRGETRIQWSSSATEMQNISFGLWFSSVSPVDASRPADQSVFYSLEMTEYQTTFSQAQPCYTQAV